jgi:quinol monooxygenase YgiN
MRLIYLTLLIALTFNCSAQENQKKENINMDKMMIRISEIEIEPEYLNEYLSILKEEARASVELEPGVISIYPMFQKENPNEIRILEIYTDKKAYENHLQTPHFKHYKTTTLKMVKSLKLIDMSAIDEQTMPKIFKKIGQWHILQGGVHWCANSAPTTYKLPLAPKSFRESSIPRKLFRYYTFCSKLCGSFFQVFSCIFY